MTTIRKRIKSVPGWLVVLFVFVVFLVVGIQRDSGPSTPQERIDAVSQRLACPTCDGESVFESRGSASVSIKKEVARLVSAGQLTDDEIVKSIESSFGEDVLLVPRSTGLDAVAWALPVAVAVVAVVGLVIVFRRWRREGSVHASVDDERIVFEALREAQRDS